MTAAISNSTIGLLHRYTGRGPPRARTPIGENIIVCVIGATLTKGERSLVGDGKAEWAATGPRPRAPLTTPDPVVR